MFVYRPLSRLVVSSPFGLRDLDDDGEYEQHNGTDYDGDVGDALFAMGDGVVERAINVDSGANGKHVVIVDDDDGRYIYLHMNDVFVVEGQRVAAGQQVGTVGNTGASRGAHLHLQWQPDGRRNGRVDDIDPVIRLLPPPPTSRGGGWLLALAAVGGVFWWARRRRRKR